MSTYILQKLKMISFCWSIQYPFVTVGLRAQKYTQESDDRRFWTVSVTRLSTESSSDWNLVFEKSLALLPFPNLCLTNIYSGGKFPVCLYHMRAGIESVVSYSQFRFTVAPINAEASVVDWRTASCPLQSGHRCT